MCFIFHIPILVVRWPMITKVPVTELGAVSEGALDYCSFIGMYVEDNNNPKGICVRWESATVVKYIASELHVWLCVTIACVVLYISLPLSRWVLERRWYGPLKSSVRVACDPLFLMALGPARTHSYSSGVSLFLDREPCTASQKINRHGAPATRVHAKEVSLWWMREAPCLHAKYTVGARLSLLLASTLSCLYFETRISRFRTTNATDIFFLLASKPLCIKTREK